jgi:hypothetical protein
MRCVEKGDAPPFIHGAKAVLRLFLARCLGLDHLSMKPCHHISKERLRSASKGLAAP